MFFLEIGSLYRNSFDILKREKEGRKQARKDIYSKMLLLSFIHLNSRNFTG